MKLSNRVCLIAMVGVCAVSGARAAGTNAPIASTNAPAPVRDYRAMLQRVRAKQEARDGLEEVQQAVRTFQLRVGRLPAELTEVIARGILPALPPAPPEMRYAYDRIRGNVTLTPVPDAIGKARTNLTGHANVVLPPR
jgi:hypothetical protein